MAKVNPRKNLEDILRITEKITSKSGVEIIPQFSGESFFLSNQGISEFYSGSTGRMRFSSQLQDLQKEVLRNLIHAANAGSESPEAQNLSLRGRRYIFGGFDDPGIMRLKAMSQLASGTLDLGLLSRPLQYQLADRYANEVLRLPDVVEQLGFPAYSAPTANPYNNFFQYLVNPMSGASVEEGIHPASFLLGKASINVKKSIGRIEDIIKTARGTMLSAVGVQELEAQRKKDVGDNGFSWSRKKFKYLWS